MSWLLKKDFLKTSFEWFNILDKVILYIFTDTMTEFISMEKEKEKEKEKENNTTLSNKNIILDMDDTLIHCFNQYNMNEVTPRPYLREFFEYIFQRFQNVSIWTYATKDWFDYVYTNVLQHVMPENASFDFVWVRHNCRLIWRPTKQPRIANNTHSILGANGHVFTFSMPIHKQPSHNTIHPLIIHKPLEYVYKAYPDTYTIHNTRIVDDTVETYQENVANAIPIMPFIYRHDRELLRLIQMFRSEEN